MTDNNTRYLVTVDDGKFTKEYSRDELFEKSQTLNDKYQGRYRIDVLQEVDINNIEDADTYRLSVDDGNFTKTYTRDELKGKRGVLSQRYGGRYKVDAYRGTYDDITTVLQNDAEELEREIDEWSHQNGSFMREYEDAEKIFNSQEVARGFVMTNTPQARMVYDNAQEYGKKQAEIDELRRKYYSNPLVIWQREGDAGFARQMAENYAAAADRMETENPELARKAKAVNAAMPNPRGGMVGFVDDDVKQYNEDRSNYETARRMAESAQDIYAAPSKYDDSVGVVNFLKGGRDVTKKADFWTMGLVGMADNFNVRDALMQVQEKLGGFDNITEEDIDRKLTPSEKAMVVAFTTNALAQASRANDLSRGYQAGQGATESLGFMAQFLLTGGAGEAAAKGVTNGMTRWLARQLGNMAPGLARSTAKIAGKGLLGTIESVTKAAVMTPMMPQTWRTISDEMVEITDEGKLQEANTAFWHGMGDAMIETWSENAGGMVENILGVPLSAGKTLWNKALGNTAFGRWGLNLTRTPAYKLMKQSGWNGFLGEMGEEWVGNMIRTVTGLDPDALKDFATVDNQIITMTSFAPMSVLGLGTSAAQFGAARKRATKAAEHLFQVMRGAGYTEEQIRFTIDDVNASTPRQLSETLTPVVNQIARDSDNGALAFKAVMEYADAVAKYRTLDGFYQREQEAQMDDAREEIVNNTGQQFWQTREVAEGVTTDNVRVLTTEEGVRMFVVGQGEDGMLAVVKENGEKAFITKEEAEGGTPNGPIPEGERISNDESLSLRDFLRAEVMRKKQTAEQERMSLEHATRISDVKSVAVPGTQINLGTEEAPIMGDVLQQTPDGVMVQADGKAILLTWEEAANAMKIGSKPMTDAEIEEQEADEIEQARAQRELERARTEQEVALASSAEEVAAVASEDAEPLPLKQDGSVDQTTLWNKSPERWARWNDEQRQDGGVNSINYINNALAKAQKDLDSAVKAYDKETDFEAREAMEEGISAKQERVARLSALQQSYLPENAQEQAAAQVAQETAGVQSPATQAEPSQTAQALPAPEQTIYDLFSDESLSEDEIEAYIDANVAGSQSDLDKHLNKAPKMGRDMEKYKADKAKHEEKTRELTAIRDHWRQVRAYLNPSTVEMDAEPQNALEAAAKELTRKDGISLLPESFRHHTGYGRGEQIAFLSILRKKENGGMTLEAAGERLMADYPEFFDQNDPNAGLNAILEVLQSAASSSDLYNYINNAREDAARQEADAVRSAVIQQVEDAKKQTNVPYHLSEEVDENGRQFVLTSNGSLSFGEIGTDTGLTPAPILLSEGLITNPATNDGYGLVHIEARHGEQIRNAGYSSVVDFIEEVARNYDVIREGRNRDGNQTYMLQLTDKHNNTLMVELSGDGTYWNINTAGIFKTSYGANRKEVYNRHTTDRQSAETAEVSQDAEQGGTQSSSSMNTPTSSSIDKDSNNPAISNESEENVDGFTSTLDEDMPDFENMSDEEVKRIAIEAVVPETERQRFQDEKRNTLKDRIREWEQRLGAKVKVMDSIDDVTNSQAKAQIEKGSEVWGWFETSTGEVCIYLPDFMSLSTSAALSEIDKTYIHEIVSHKGLRGLLGEDAYGELCDMVWEAMTEEEQQSWMQYPGVNGNTRAAADEYIAHFAESVEYNQTIWDKIVKFIKDLFASKDVAISISDEGLTELLRASYDKLVSEASARMEPEKISLNDYLGRLGLSSPISDYMDDKLRNPHGLSESQRNQLEKEAKAAADDYHARRNAAIDEYNRMVAEGKIIPPTQIGRLIATANGHPDNEATQAARRSLEKRGYDWQSGQKKSAEVKSEPEKASKTIKAEKAKDEKIEDFGEKIGGARKDAARSKIRDAAKLTRTDLKKLNDPDKILSRKQIIKYVSEGQMTIEDAQTLLAANMAVRGESYTQKEVALEKYRNLAVAWEKGETLDFSITEQDVEVIYDTYTQKIKDNVPDLREKVRKSFENTLMVTYSNYLATYKQLNYPIEYRDLKGLYVRYGDYDGRYWVVDRPGARRGWPKASMDAAVAFIKERYPIIETNNKPSKKNDDSKESFGHLYVAKSQYGGYRIKSRDIPGEIYISNKDFVTRKLAEAYLKENATRLMEKEQKMAEALMGSNIGMVERQGKDYRNGKDVTPQDFLDTFGFRGVEFGNWVPQAERQMYLNKTYDAIMDFCEVVGISPKAFSLGGRLGLAFGARGKSRALAHYEPMKEVINLTRMKGAGSLAHEWFHALDNYLAKQNSGDTSDMATASRKTVREEVSSAFDAFVKKMNSLAYTRRSNRAGEYWGEVWERAARLFESYVYNELGGRGTVSPLLVREDVLFDETEMSTSSSWWPYPSERENEEMKPYFDALFDAIQEQNQEDGNITLFRTQPERDDNVAGVESLVERTYRTSGAFSFSGKDQIESREDVAFIFRQLEDSAVENSFLVLVKDGVPTILHVGMGGPLSTTFDNSVVLPAYKDFGADKVYMVHNHPSGALLASQADVDMLATVQRQLSGAAPVEGIIIDTVSGQYGYFTSTSTRTKSADIPTTSDEVELEVLSFDKNVFSPDYKSKLNERKIQGPRDIAAFISAHRLGEGTKVGALLLNSHNVINGNLIANDNEVSMANVDALASQIAETANRTGASSVILFGDFDYSDRALRALTRKIKEISGDTVNMLDVVRLEGRHTQSLVDDTLPSRSTLSDGVRFRASNENQAIFVSNAARAVEGIKQEKATPEQWLKMIEKNGGLKAGEDKWMGLSDWLKASNKKTLTKADVLDFINENMIVIEETHYAENAEADAENTYAMIERILQEKFDNYIAEYYEQNNGEDDNLYGGDSYEYAMDKLREEMNDEFPYTIERSNSVVYLTFPYEETDDLQEWADKLGVKFAPQNPINNTRFVYTTDGLNNRHEIALTIPTIEPWNESDEVHFGDAGNGRAVAWIRFGETWEQRPSPQISRKVLVIDEIQSKRHQEGREKGYKKSNDEIYKALEAFQSFNRSMKLKYGPNSEVVDWSEEDKAEFNRLRDAHSEASKGIYGGVPDAPFDKNWHELAMKRMLRYAAENGYDVIAWTKGEQQAERYNLSHLVKRISVSKPTEDGSRIVNIHYRDEYDDFKNLVVDADGKIVHGEYAGNTLADVVGKEMALQIMNSEEATEFKGEGLKVGGEGMKGFYDRMLPAFMNKYGKKWGVKVEDIELPNLEKSARIMHSVPVTEEMKASVMEGQVMFRATGITPEVREEMAEIKESAERAGTYLKAPNGADTNLTAEQWALVRTKAFKAWFGDWEKAARIQKLRNSEPVMMDGNEHEGKYELNRESAQRYILDELRDTYTIADTNERIKIVKRGAKKVTSHSMGNDAHMRSIAIIPEIIKSAIFITEMSADKADAQYDSYRYYVCGLEYAGESYTVKMTVGVKNGDYYYDHTLTDIEKGKLLDMIESQQGVSREGFTPTGNESDPSYALSDIKDKKLVSILQTNASKVVDANGEPMVVYHGTLAKNLTRFDKDFIGSRYSYDEKGFFFISRESIANDYATPDFGTGRGAIIPAFINLKNPLFVDQKWTAKNGLGNRVFKDNDVIEFWDNYQTLMIEESQNNDGVIISDGTDLMVVAFEPSQIKSATDNTGEFSADNNDIRFRTKYDVNTNPSEAQKKAGNYKMGHIRLDGYNITIENPKGSVRRGTDSKGNAWENTLNNDYGYIRGTEGVDGDHIDVYLSDNPSEGNVFVIDQVNPQTREFDEHKVMYGFNSPEEAREAYLANFSEGWNGLGTITEVSKDEFKKWIDSSHRKTKPFSEYKSVKTMGGQSESYNEEVFFNDTGTPTEDVVARGLELSRQDAARLAGDIYSIMPADIRKQVSAEALNNGMDLQKTIFQISASLAEKDSLSDEETAFAKSVADILEQRLLNDGVEMTRPLTTSEALWMLWRNSNPVGEDDVFGAARRAVVADNLGMSTRFRAADKRNDSDNRSKQFREATASAAADAYNRSVSFWKNRLKESYVDNMDSVNILVEAIEKASGKAAQGWEDIRLTMNQLSSKGLSAMEKFIRDYLHPMWDAVEAIMKKMDIDKADVERYIMLESGLERNEVFAKRDAKAKHQDEYDKQIRSIEGMEVTDEEKAALKVKAKNTLDRRLAAVDAGTDATYKKMRERDYGAVMAQFAEYAPIKDQSAYGSLEEYNRAKLNSRRLKYSTVEEAESAAWEEINAFRQKAGEELIDNLWKRINAATKATLKQQYEANMLSKAQYDHIRGMFKYYVPMRGFADNTAEDMYSYYANGQNDFAAPVLKAKGRTTMAESPLGHIGAMASSGIAQGMKNEAKLALYYFVLNRPNDLISVDKTWYVDTGRADEEGKAIFEAKYPPMTGALSEEKARADYEKWQNEMKELEKQGKAVRGSRKLDLKNSVIHITPSSAKEHTITIKVGGEEITMFINGNPRAAQAVNGLLNIEASDKFEGMRKYLRFLSSVNTSFNPEFWMTNLQRDMLFTAMAISSKEDAQYNKAFRENYWKAWKAVTMVRKDKNGTLGDSHVEQLFKEFVENGGPTGYTKVIGNEEWEKTMNKYLSRKDRPKAESIRKAFDALQSFSEGIEQVSRFAAYMTSREMGRSVQQSISDAKEVTVNFNRKGSGQEITKEEADRLTDENGQPLSELSKFCIRMISKISPYGRGFLMFFNASVQGLNSFVRLTKNNPKAMSIWASGYLMLGILNASLHAMLDDDDEYLDIPDYERRTSLLLGGNGAYFKWALPQEARAFYALGDLFVNRTLDRMPHQNVVWEATKILFDVAPLNPTEGVAGVLPPFFATAVELWTNKDYKGAKIRKDMAYLSDEAKKGVPEYTKTFSGTSEVAVALSRAINWLSGGDYATSGYLDGFLTNPAVMQHVVESQLGGTLRTINKTLDTIWNIGGLAVGSEDAEFTVRNTPFLNRLLTINDERYRNSHTTDLYKHYKGVAANAKRREKEYSAAHDSENLNSLRSSEDYAVFQIYQRHKKVLDMYDKQLKLARNEQERRLIMQRQDAERKRMIEEISRL